MIDIKDHLGLAHMVCKAYRNQTGRAFSYDDLFQAACEGLLRAAQTYDPELGRFSTYAVPLARLYVRRLVATQARTVKVPQYAQDAAAAARAPEPPRVEGRRRRTTGGAFDWGAPGASASTGAPIVGRAKCCPLPYMGPPAAWIDGATAAGIHSPGAERSLDSPTGESGDGSLHDLLPAAPEKDVDFEGDLARIDAIASRAPELTEAERLVMRSRLVGATQPELAGFLSVTKQRIGQIEASAVEKLQKRLKKA